MDLKINLETLHQQCRICFQRGDINIWDYKVNLPQEKNSSKLDSDHEISFIQLMDIFYNSHDLLNLREEFPLICWQCLEDLKYCYIFYEKIKLSHIQLNDLYQESLSQCIEEEHLIEIVDEKDIPEELNEITNLNQCEVLEEEILNFIPYNINHTNHSANNTNCTKKMPLDKNNAFVITQFVPETFEATEKMFPRQIREDDEECQPQQHLLTVNLKAVEVKNLENLESSQDLSTDILEPAVYICKYCPQAFAKSDYLKTHVQKSHVCKFCTQPFSITEELFRHIREIHNEHKCAICHKLLSSHTNLRHHIKKVHRIKLPAKVTLLDFIKSTNETENEVEVLQDDLGTAEMDFDTQYLWQNDDCIEMLSESNAVIN